MPRKVGWKDQSIKSGFGRGSDDKKFKGINGIKHLIRIVTDCMEMRVHGIDDVLEPREDGEPRVFNMNCAMTWSDDEDDWVGECLACDRGYDVNVKYVCGIIVLAEIKGQKIQKIDPENCVYWWPFGADKYRKLSDIALDLETAAELEGGEAKTLDKIDIMVTCEDENWQRLDLKHFQGKKSLLKKAHVDQWKEEGPDLLKEAMKGDKPKVQERQLKKKKPRKSSDSDDDDDEVEVSSSRKARKKVVKKPKKPVVEEEDEGGDDDEGDEEDLNELLDF